MNCLINKIERNISLLVCCVSLLFTLSCNSDLYDGSLLNGSMRFNLSTVGYEGDTPIGRSVTNFDSFKSASHYVFDNNQELVKDVRILYDAATSGVIIENLQDGNYSLLLLMHNANSNELIKTSDVSKISDKWLTFDESHTMPIGDEYFYANHPFTVSDGVVSQNEINLKRIVSRFDFNLNFANNYVEKTVESIELIPDDGHFTNSFHADNKYTGENLLAATSLLEDRSIMIFPKSDNQEFSGRVKITWKPDGNEIIVKEYRFTAPINPNRLSVINIDIHHPRNNLGTIIINDADYNEANFYKILQDGESKDIYTNVPLRSFHINKPLQISFTDDKKLHLRFYSAVPVKNILVLAKIKGVNHQVEVFHIESIPSFADISLSLTLTEKSAIYKTREGEYIEIDRMADITAKDIEFEIVSDDIYLEKISKIIPQWKLYFSTYGSDPDLPNGGLGDNFPWLGIRPVHIRESIALLTNVAYMFSMEDYSNLILNYEGDFIGNQGVILDKTKVLQQFITLQQFRIGLVYNYLGYAGGHTYGLNQDIFFNHYIGSALYVVFHEMAHCIGYNHTSNLTYGEFAEKISNTYYLQNISNFPVNSSSYLDSNNNPNKYIF